MEEVAIIASSFTAIDARLKEFETSYSTHKHKFGDLEELPTTLAGYGIKDGMTATQISNAIKKATNALVDGEEALDTLKKLAEAVGSDPEFAANVKKALDCRVRVDTATSFTLAQKTQARANIGALGTVDRGAAGGVASLDTFGKVPPAQLPTLTTTSTVGAAIAGANGKAVPADGDFIAGVEAGGSTMFKTTWANIKAAFVTLVNSIVAGNMAGRAYPRRSDGAAMNFMWSGQGGQPAWLWGGTGAEGDGGTYKVWNPSNFSVNYANSAWNSERVQGWDVAGIQNDAQNRANDRGYWRTRDYLLAEHVPVGGYAFLRAANGVKVDPGGVVGGNALGWSNVNHEYIGPINYGQWQLCGWIKGTGYGEDQTTSWKRIG